MNRRDLRKWRELRNLSQSEAAKLYGCTLRQWQRYESGETPIPRHFGLWLAQVSK